MAREYDIFEQYSDGSSIWRECVVGHDNALLKLREAQSKSPSKNEFYAINISDGATIHCTLPSATKAAVGGIS